MPQYILIRPSLSSIAWGAREQSHHVIIVQYSYWYDNGASVSWGNPIARRQQESSMRRRDLLLDDDLAVVDEPRSCGRQTTVALLRVLATRHHSEDCVIRGTFRCPTRGICSAWRHGSCLAERRAFGDACPSGRRHHASSLLRLIVIEAPRPTEPCSPCPAPVEMLALPRIRAERAPLPEGFVSSGGVDQNRKNTRRTRRLIRLLAAAKMLLGVAGR